MELSNSHVVVELGLDEIPSTLGSNFLMLRPPIAKVSSFHVIFDLNGIPIATHFEKADMEKLHLASLF